MAAYGAYALLAAPWLEPRAMGRSATSDSPMRPVEVDESFRDLFPPDAWERDNPKIVETAQCTLLLKDYRPLPDGRMEINPCTLIFYAAAADGPDSKGLPFQRRRPIVLRAPKGAVLQFDRPIDVGRATVGRLMEGTLRGKIHIFSPPSRPGASDALDLTPRNVKIDREKVYTPSAVDFRYGGSFGRGHDLTITLLPEDKENKGRSASLGGLSVLQLARVERLHLEGDAGGLMPTSPAADGTDSVAPAKDLPLEVRCDGPLVVDFEQNLAALDENVEISRVYSEGPPDRLTCDRLIFHLVERTSARAAKGSRQKPAGASENSRQLTELVERAIAIGSPVVLDAPQAAMFAKAARVEYLAANRRIALESGPSAPEVTLRYQESQFAAREIEYELAEPGRIGRLWAAGPGRLKFVPAAGQKAPPVEASWQTELTIIPDEKNKVVSLKGQPAVKLDGGGSFSTRDRADGKRLVPGEIYLWMLEVPVATKASGAAVKPQQQPPRESSKPEIRYVILPDRMLATGQVEVDSPQLAAHTTELRAWFLNQAPPAQRAKGAGAMFDPAPPPQQKPADDRTQLQKLDVTGALIQLQILRRGNESAIENLAITGGVRVIELALHDPSAPAPLELTGDMVTLRQGSSPHAKLEIHGKPAAGGQPAQNARVSARGLSLSGATIHLRRADNRLWIPGPGEAILPMPEDDGSQRPLIPPPNARGRSSSRPLKVTWQDAFEFDGEKGVFSGTIEASGEAEIATGEELTVTLNQRIDFAAPRQEGKVEVARLHFTGGQHDVIMQRVVNDKLGQRSAFDNARVRSLEIDRTTGKIHAAGPGEVWTVRKDLKALPGGGLMPAGRTAGNSAAGKLSYVCVTFQGQIVGDLNHREITFQRQVDTIYGLVSDWNERVAATRAEDLGESGVHVLSDTLKITEMGMSPDHKWIEIDAAGNTQAEGFKFFAQADRISYTSDKDQLIISGDGRSPAEFWHRTKPGGDFSQVKARRFIFQRSNNVLQMDDAQSIDIGNLPRGGKPVPKLR